MRLEQVELLKQIASQAQNTSSHYGATYFSGKSDFPISKPQSPKRVSFLHSLKRTYSPLGTQGSHFVTNIAADDGENIFSMQGRRSISSRREAPRLPRIAPRTGTGPSTLQTQRPIPPPRTVLPNASRTRLPPRSKSGCWLA